MTVLQTTQADHANKLTPPLRLRSCLFWGLGMLVYLIPLAALYAESYSAMLRQWNGEDSNYCYVVPLVVAYLIWEKRAELRGLAYHPSWWGLLPLTFGALLYLLGELGGGVLHPLSILLVHAGGVALVAYGVA